MRQIPVDTSAATVMVAQPPQPKIRDRRTGEVATDAETGATMMTVGVMFAANGEAEILTVAVPERRSGTRRRPRSPCTPPAA
ncbi:hypothetical protein AB0C60_31160, partial [Streptomyces sp. NPDC048845]